MQAPRPPPPALAPLGHPPPLRGRGELWLWSGAWLHGNVDLALTGVIILNVANIRLVASLAIATAFVASCTSAETTTTTSPPDRVLSVANGEAPKIDGVVASGEWDGATSTMMTNGTPLRWMHADEALYVAVEGGDIGAVNLTLATDDEVWILHSSAALGSALYTREQSSWSLTHDFNWCCRSTTDDASRRTLFDDEGWQANIGFAGDVGVVEYEVVLPWVDGLAAVSYQTESGDPAYWPTDLSGTAEAALVGPWPEAEDFHVDEWYVLESGAG